MTREQFINKLIERYKTGDRHYMISVCDEIECLACPYYSDGTACYTTDLFLDEIIRLKEKKPEKVETNFEHYYEGSNKGWNQTESVPMIWFKKECLDQYENMKKGDFVKWLLSPYEEPKRYQMSQLCYDMIARWLERYDSGEFGNGKGAIYVFIHVLIDMGLWRDWYDETSRNDIELLRILLENAEVVE